MSPTDIELAQQCAAALPHWLWLLAAPIALPHLDALIKQPAPGSLWLLIRKPLSLLLGNYGWARNAGQETLAEWWTENRQMLAAWIVKAAGEALKAEIAKAAAPPPSPPDHPEAEPADGSPPQ